MIDVDNGLRGFLPTNADGSGACRLGFGCGTGTAGRLSASSAPYYARVGSCASSFGLSHTARCTYSRYRWLVLSQAS